MRAGARLGAVAAVSGAILLCALPARAEPTPADRALATALFDKGRTLIADGKIAEACPVFAESQRLDPSLGTLLNLASCHEQDGKLASAWTELSEAVAVAERERQEERRAFAAQKLAALEPRLPRLVVILPPELAQAGNVVVERDGAELPNVALGIAMPIDPGTHTITARRPGHEPWSKTITIAERERVDVNVGPLVPERAREPFVAPPPAPVPDKPVTLPRAESPPPNAPRRAPYVALGLAGVGVAAVAVGAVAGILALDKSARSGTLCSPRCNDEGFDLNGGAKTAADVSTVSFILGGAALGAAAVIFFASRPAARTTGWSIGPSGVVF